jgi:P27 family predicted phage terminase small subunit
VGGLTSGRRPKPTAIKLLQGTARPSRSRNRGPEQAEVARPPKPTHLGKVASEEWERLAELSERRRVLTAADGPILEAAVMAYATLRQASRVLDRLGLVYRTDSGMLRPRPEAAIGANAWRMYVTALSHFGLTPACREKVRAAPPKDPKGSWFDRQPIDGGDGA